MTAASREQREQRKQEERHDPGGETNTLHPRPQWHALWAHFCPEAAQLTHACPPFPQATS
jgi:hypothetical protein